MGQGSTDITVAEFVEREVQFRSRDVLYVEGLTGGHWLGRGWDLDGDAGRARGGATAPAFEVYVKPDPAAAAGTLVSGGWEWVSGEELPAPDSGRRHFSVTLSNHAWPLRVNVHTLLDGTPVLTRWLQVTNLSEKPVALSAVYPWSGRLWPTAAPIALGYATKWRVPWEGWFSWKMLLPGTNVVENDKGLVWDDPYFVLRNEANGEYFFGQLAWPANYRMVFDLAEGLSFRIGPSAVNELRVMAPGEMVASPAVHLGHVRGDFDDAVQAMHDHVRRSVLPTRRKDRAYLVQYLFPEDQRLTVYHGADYNETNVKKCVDVAAAVGVEVFIVDGPTWARGYGDWVPKEEWFPRGLTPVREYAHDKGMLFGVYAEPEGGRGDWSETQAFRDHPDWFVRRNPMFPEPNFVNMSIPEAAAYAEAELTELIDRLELDIYRHDQNGCFGDEGSVTLRDGFLENDYWRHYEAFYGMVARIHERYPDLILQQASGGGTRLELATLSRFDEHYTSDRAAKPFVYQMSSGLSVYLPPEVLVTPNGMVGLDRRPDLTTLLRCIYALGNTPMIFNGVLPCSIEDLSPELRERYLHYAEIYKSFIRPLLPTCRVYHHAPVNATSGVESGGWFAMEFMAPDRTRGWATIIRYCEDTLDTYLLKPKGVDQQAHYSVTFDNTGVTENIRGARLVADGLSVELGTDPASELVLFEAQ